MILQQNPKDITTPTWKKPTNIIKTLY